MDDMPWRVIFLSENCLKSALEVDAFQWAVFVMQGFDQGRIVALLLVALRYNLILGFRSFKSAKFTDLFQRYRSRNFTWLLIYAKRFLS